MTEAEGILAPPPQTAACPVVAAHQYVRRRQRHKVVGLAQRLVAQAARRLQAIPGKVENVDAGDASPLSLPPHVRVVDSEQTEWVGLPVERDTVGMKVACNIRGQPPYRKPFLRRRHLPQWRNVDTALRQPLRVGGKRILQRPAVVGGEI
jgi:hypothetical protein